MNTQEPNHYQIDDDEITLKELIMKIKEFWHELLKNWLWIGFIILPFFGFFVYKAMTTKPTYDADLTFMVNDDEGGGMGGMAGLLGTFGLGGKGGGEFNLEKMLQLLKTRKILQTVLFQKETIDGQNDYYGNHIINLYEWHEKWKEDTTGLKNFLFTSDRFLEFDNSSNRALKSIHSQIIGNSKKKIKGILSSSYDEDTGIMKIEIKSINEDFSIKFLNALFDELSRYYIAKTIEKPKITHDIVKEKRDSIFGALQSSQYALASFMDANRGLFKVKDQLKRLRLEGKVKELTAMYTETVKNLEMADFSLKNKTPVIQAIDTPLSPIEPTKISLIKNGLIGILLGGFLGAFYFIGRKIFRDAMATE